MIKYTIILFFALLYQYKSQSQSNIDKVKNKLAADLKKAMNDNSWTLEVNSTNISLKFTEIFFLNTVMGPLNNTYGSYNKPDSIYIRIRFEENWNQSRVDSLKIKHYKILDPLIKKYITYHDSLNWRYMKSNREMFMERPYSNLKHWNGLNKFEKISFDSIIRLPDGIVDNIGFFVDVDYTPHYIFIEPQKIEDKVNLSYQSFSKILGKSALYKYEDKY